MGDRFPASPGILPYQRDCVADDLLYLRLPTGGIGSTTWAYPVQDGPLCESVDVVEGEFRRLVGEEQRPVVGDRPAVVEDLGRPVDTCPTHRVPLAAQGIEEGGQIVGMPQAPEVDAQAAVGPPLGVDVLSQVGQVRPHGAARVHARPVSVRAVGQAMIGGSQSLGAEIDGRCRHEVVDLDAVQMRADGLRVAEGRIHLPLDEPIGQPVGQLRIQVRCPRSLPMVGVPVVDTDMLEDPIAVSIVGRTVDDGLSEGLGHRFRVTQQRLGGVQCLVQGRTRFGTVTDLDGELAQSVLRAVDTLCVVLCDKRCVLPEERTLFGTDVVMDGQG